MFFSKAWLESVTDANAIARFKKSCGVFSFNSNVFRMFQMSGNSPTSELVHSTEATAVNESSARQVMDSNSIFSVDQE